MKPSRAEARDIPRTGNVAMRFHIQFPGARAALALLNAVYLATGLAWILLIPYNNAPDENTHFHYSVEFIMEHRRLPVWGVDDIGRFRHALSSYNQMPALNYVLYAAGASAAERFGLEPYLGARLVSLAFGLVFVNFLFLAAREICGNERNALMAAAAAALIPQVMFSFCYVNAEAHSLAIAAVLAFALSRLACRPSTGALLAAGAAIGLLFSAKYNYFIYLPFIAAMLLLALYRREIDRAFALKLAVAASVFSLLISGCWYIRNWALYGNPIPILMGEEYFKNLGIVREVQPVNRGVSLASLAWLARSGFFGMTFDSFFGVFGYMNVGFSNIVYIMLQFIVPLVALFFILDLALTRDGRATALLACLMALFGAILVMHVWACLTYDYQAQGRYYFAILPPAVLYAAWAATRQPSLRKHVVFFLILMLWLFAGANLLVARTYAPALRLSVALGGREFSDRPPVRASAAAARAAKNFYTTGRMALAPACEASSMRVLLPDNCLARYRDFLIEFETEGGTFTNDWIVCPPRTVNGAYFNPQLNAFEVRGYNASFTAPIAVTNSRICAVTISFRLENRRLYDFRY